MASERLDPLCGAIGILLVLNSDVSRIRRTALDLLPERYVQSNLANNVHMYNKDV